MSRQHESFSFSIDLCRDALTAFGGEHTQSTLGLAFKEFLAAEEASTTVEGVQESLGGVYTASTLGQAFITVEQVARHFEDQSKPEPKAKAKVNLTARWLTTHGREVRAMLVEHLTHKLQTSRRVGVVEDHVQTFLCRLVERDTLAPHLEAGKTPQASVLRIWAYQSACTEMRGWGVDASLRTSRGAKTNRDRQADAGKLPVVAITSPETVIERRYEVENGEVVSDLYNPHTNSAEDELISAETLERARALVLRKIAGAGPRYAALFDALVDGGKRSDLASDAGVSRNRMASMLSRIREVLRDDDTLSS